MHDTHLGSHAPPRINQLPMAEELHDFCHIKHVGQGNTVTVLEKGGNPLVAGKTTKFQKYFWKMQLHPNRGYDHRLDLPNDPFLDSLTNEEKEKFDKDTNKIWMEKTYHEEDPWYMVLEGTNRMGVEGTNTAIGPNGLALKIALYQDKETFENARDMEYSPEELQRTNNQQGWSNKGGWFDNLEAAKNYIQMARDEEGNPKP